MTTTGGVSIVELYANAGRYAEEEEWLMAGNSLGLIIFLVSGCPELDHKIRGARRV
jgi:hypothetical protein